MRYYDYLLKNVNKLLAGLIQKEKVIAFCISNHLLSFLFNKVYFFPDTLQSQFLLNTSRYEYHLTSIPPSIILSFNLL